MVSLSFRMLCWFGHVVEPRFSVSPKLTLPMSFLRDFSSSRVLFIYIIVMPWQLKNTGFAGCFQNHHSGHPHDSVLYDYFSLVRYVYMHIYSMSFLEWHMLQLVLPFNG